MIDLAWMAWTWETGAFFAALVSTLGVMTALGLRFPEAEAIGAFGIPTTRGDRLFISLLGSAFIHLGWLALAPFPLVWGSVVALLWAAFVFRFV